MKYEAHITIEPVVGERLEKLKALCEPAGFKVADLLMLKREADLICLDTVTRSAFDTFATAKGSNFHELCRLGESMVKSLGDAGFQVWRLKVEKTLYDVRYKNGQARRVV